MAQSNNYDFMRVAAAISVIISHQFALFGLPEPLVLQYQTLGGFGVLVFFSISGYLVGHSWDSDPNLFRFAARRMLRIWPAYILVVLICLFLIGPAFTSDSIRSYFVNSVTWSYFKNLIFIFQPFLPGVFSSSPVQYVPNGVYWTLPIEVFCYFLVAVLGAVGFMRFRWLILALVIGVSYWYYLYYDAQTAISTGGERYYYVQYGTFFFYGVLLRKFRECWIGRKLGVLVVVMLLSSWLYLCGARLLALFVLLPYAINAFGEISTPVVRSFGRFGDASYGLYIYAFPIQQIILQALGREGLFAEKLLLVIACTWGVSLLSWRYLESPALKMKPRKKGRQAIGAPEPAEGPVAINTLENQP